MEKLKENEIFELLNTAIGTVARKLISSEVDSISPDDQSLSVL